jgi:hypothetical protein
LFPTIDIKNGTAHSWSAVGSLNFISAGLDPFTQGIY